LFDLLFFFNAMLDTNKEKCKIFFQSSNVRGVCSTSLGDQRHWLCGIWYFLTARAPCYFQTWCMVKYVTFLNFPYLFCHSTAAYGQLESICIDSLLVCMSIDSCRLVCKVLMRYYVFQRRSSKDTCIFCVAYLCL
jgi:hypothetical protein